MRSLGSLLVVGAAAAALAWAPAVGAAESAKSTKSAAGVEPADRIASLVPFVARALDRMPGDRVVVACVRQKLHEAPPDDTIDLGNPHAPSLERLAEARADLVVADRLIHASLEEKLGRFGGRVVFVDQSSVDATFESLLEVARAAGREEPMRAEIEAARERLAGLTAGESIETLTLFGAPGNFMAMTERTWLGDLLAQLGFANVASGALGSERFAGFVAITDERMTTLRPELVLLLAHGDPDAIRAAFVKRLEGGGPWRSVGESASRGVHALDPDLFGSNPGLAMPDAAAALVALAGAAAPHDEAGLSEAAVSAGPGD